MPPENSPATGAAAEPAFGSRELEEARWLVDRAIREDLPEGDLTTDPLFGGQPSSQSGTALEADYVPREGGVLCGVPVLRELFAKAPGVQLLELQADGDSLVPGSPCLKVKGPAGVILRLERVSLNFIQRLSGIASETRRWVEAIAGTGAALLDTRKTTPAWRQLEKYAVRTGGGENHRKSLSEAILLKDNHLEALRWPGSKRLADIVAVLRKSAPETFLEVEVSTREEYLEALETTADCILLDNFALEDLRWAVETRAVQEGKPPLLEASGGLQLERVREVAETGVDRISVGALTHSARAVDIGLDLVGLDGVRRDEAATE